jgi:Lrp/AsnC family transcriptional regulator, leucine-responsive regulatory protein
LNLVQNLDERDLKLLRLLQADARLGNNELAAKVALSPSACLRRVRALEEAGFIDRTVAILDHRAAGFGGSAVVHVTLESQERKALDRFEAAVARVSAIVECYLLAGPADYLLRVVYRDNDELERLHGDVLTRLPGVQRIQSTLTLRTVKRTTALPI